MHPGQMQSAPDFPLYIKKRMTNYPQENIKPYNDDEKKSVQVEKMFDNIAPAYDQLNHALSWNIDKSWRRKAINWLKPFHPQRMMDVATGTGDFAIQACRILQPEELIGTDISEGMMNVGREKVKAAGLESRISFAKEDCTALTFPDKRFDAITVAFGVRNFEDLDKGLREIHRVLDDNGKLVILELSEPDWSSCPSPRTSCWTVTAGWAAPPATWPPSSPATCCGCGEVPSAVRASPPTGTCSRRSIPA